MENPLCAYKMSAAQISEEIKKEIWTVRQFLEAMWSLSLEDLNLRLYDEFVQPLERVNALCHRVKPLMSERLSRKLDKFIKEEITQSYINCGDNIRDLLHAFFDSIYSEYKRTLDDVPRRVHTRPLSVCAAVCAVLAAAAAFVSLWRS